jgi:hypothetical protein
MRRITHHLPLLAAAALLVLVLAACGKGGGY